MCKLDKTQSVGKVSMCKSVCFAKLHRTLDLEQWSGYEKFVKNRRVEFSYEGKYQ